MHEYQILVDSDAFVGRFFPDDAHHHHSLELFEKFENSEFVLATTNTVIGETATVLSHRRGQDLAVRFLDVIKRSQIPIIHIDEQLHQRALALFEEQRDRGTSYTDCANVAVIQQLSIEMIFSFDKVYSKKFHLQVAA